MTLHHIYVIGRSGSGKSTFLENHALDNPGGWIFVDPHGDSAGKLADTVPCIYWDASDRDAVVALNPLEHVPDGQKHLVAANVVASFKAIWIDSWGPRLEWILFNTVRVLIDAHGSVLDIPSVLTDRTVRTRIIRRSADTHFWTHEFDAWDDRYRNEAIAPVLNKVGQLCANPILAGILRRNTINLRRVMDKGQRLVVNLAKGKLGEEPSHLLGALIVSAIGQAAQGRATVPQNQRESCTLYVDEFQNFATEGFAGILSESRKFALHCVLSHQFLGQLSDQLRQAVFGNVGSFVSFRVSAEDAPSVAGELGLRNPNILTDLDPFHAYVRNGVGAQITAMKEPASPRGRLAANRRQTKAAYCLS